MLKPPVIIKSLMLNRKLVTGVFQDIKIYVCLYFKPKNKVILVSEEDHIIKTLDEATFEQLFKSNFKGLCWYAVKYVKDLDTAKEIVQDAFISLWDKRDNIDLSKSVKSYLSSIIYTRSLNYIRDNKKFNKELLGFENINQQSGYSQTDRLIEAELKERIDTAIKELPEKCREIFMLSRFENLKYQQIADKLQISVKTVEAQMSKALQHMRVRLAEYLKLIILFYFMYNN
jgi:RNA polymerase sigma-70 factor, ECF subfamily